MAEIAGIPPGLAAIRAAYSAEDGEFLQPDVTPHGHKQIGIRASPTGSNQVDEREGLDWWFIH